MFCLLVTRTSLGTTISAVEKITHSPLCVCVHAVDRATSRLLLMDVFASSGDWLFDECVWVSKPGCLPCLLYSTVAPVHPHTCRRISPGAFITKEKLKPCTNSLQPGPFLSPGMTFSLKQIALPTSPLMTANPLPVPQHIFTCIYAVFSPSYFIVLLSSRQ